MLTAACGLMTCRVCDVQASVTDNDSVLMAEVLLAFVDEHAGHEGGLLVDLVVVPPVPSVPV